MNSQAPGAAIEFAGVSKIYRKGLLGKRHQALTNLDLTVPTGSVFGFLGANGAGKTTAIKILLGLHFANGGSVRLWGQDIGDLSVKARIGYLPERPIFHGELTGHEFLDFHRAMHGERTRRNPGMSNQELLELVGIPEAGGRLLREYSKGMSQRIGIAQALVNDPDLVIFDEPMSGLDPIGRRDVRHLIDRLSQEGKTVFFSTHILSDVETLCDRIAFLEKGVLKASGSLDQILASRSSFAKEIVFEELDEAAVRSLSPLAGAQRFGTAWKITVTSPEAARAVIESVWQKRGNVVSLTSPHLSLEAALFPAKEG